MSEHTDGRIDDLSNFGDLSRIDELLESAASSIGNTDYDGAIADFEQVVEITRNVFGDSTELADVKRKIKEIQDILHNLK